MSQKSENNIHYYSMSQLRDLYKNDETNWIYDKIGNEIGLLFQIADDLIDLKGKTSSVGKKTRKDLKMGKATLISLLGANNTIKYADNLKLKIFKSLKVFGKKGDDFRETTIIEEACHWVQQEAPEKTNQALHAFINSL